MTDFDSLIAERRFLAERVAGLPPTAQLTRRSAEARLAQIDTLLTQQPQRLPRATVRLTFRGQPVSGSEGLLADFGMKAVNAFADAVAAVAASLSAPLPAMGPIPNRDANRLLITGTAVGSFGFELKELSASEEGASEPSAVSRALVHTQDLLSGTTAADDELLADAAAELDQRAIDKVRQFVAVLRDHEATCALQVGTRGFRFDDLAQVHDSFERLSQDNLHETSVVVEGQFEGLLPRRRRFEFRRATPARSLPAGFPPPSSAPSW